MLSARVEALEQALVAVAAIELGDSEGHDFHGNQWTSGLGNPVSEKLSKLLKLDDRKLSKSEKRAKKAFMKLLTSKDLAFAAAELGDAILELGDLPGHDFHGNQYTYEASYSENHEAMQRGEYKTKKIRVQADDEPTANLLAAQMVSRHGIATATKLISTRLDAKFADHGSTGTVKPGDVIVDASKVGRSEDDFSHLHGATIISSMQGLGGGVTKYTDRNGYNKMAILSGGTVTVDRPAHG